MERRSLKPWRLSTAIIILSFGAVKQKAWMGARRPKELWSSHSTAPNRHTPGMTRQPTQQSDRFGKLLRRVARLSSKASPHNQGVTAQFRLLHSPCPENHFASLINAPRPRNRQ